MIGWSNQNSDAGFAVIAETAKTWEPDRYTSALLLPREHRSEAIVISAFLGEMRKISATVSDPVIAQIRFQWWRDALAAEAATGNPLADGLAAVVKQRGIASDLLQSIIDDEEEIKLASELQTERLTARTRRETAAFEAVEHLTTPAVKQSPSLNNDAGLLYALVRANTPIAASLDDMQALITAAEALLPSVATRFSELSRRLRVFLLPLAVVRPHLGALQRQRPRAMPLSPVEISPLQRVWSIAKGHYTGRI